MTVGGSTQFMEGACRVPPIGKPLPPQQLQMGSSSVMERVGFVVMRRAAATQAATTRRSEAVRRNLFDCTAAPGEIDEMLREENERQMNQWSKRYKIMETLATYTKPQTSLTRMSLTATERKAAKAAETSPTATPTELPATCNLISEELQAYEKQIEDKCNIEKDISKTLQQPIGMKTPEAVKTTQAATAAANLLALNGERAKPYARQALITDTFKLRKTTHVVGKIAATAAAATTTQPQQQQQLVLDLPKASHATQRNNNNVETAVALTTTTTTTAAAASQTALKAASF